jgi:hypothetical protein
MIESSVSLLNELKSQAGATGESAKLIVGESSRVV